MSDLTSTALAPISLPREGATRRPASMTLILAWRNLTQDRARFAVTIVGIVFAVVLMAIQLGLLYGFATTASSLIDRAGADIWIAAHGVQNVDQTVPINEANKFKALAVPGVAAADKYVVGYADWRRADGGSESVIIVGLDLNTEAGAPWNVIQGRIQDLREPDAVMIDELYRDALGVTRLGQTVEISGRRARVVGFTRGIRTFTQSPYVFTAYDNARAYGGLKSNQTSYVLVRTANRAEISAVRDQLEASLSDVDVMTASEFSARTQNFWLFTTGAGVAVLTAALLGLIIGFVITAQTLYAATIDRLSEYGMLRAMGATPRYLGGIILQQALIAGGLGYAIGIALAAFLVFLGRDGSAAMLLPVWLGLGIGLITVAMCLAGALLSVRKVMRLQPTSVFR